MLEHLPGDHDIERSVVEREWIFNVAVHRCDPPLGSAAQGRVIDVETDDLVSAHIVLSHGARAAAEVEHPTARASDCSHEDRHALRDEHELAGLAPVAMMRLVSAPDPFQFRHALES